MNNLRVDCRYHAPLPFILKKVFLRMRTFFYLTTVHLSNSENLTLTHFITYHTLNVSKMSLIAIFLFLGTGSHAAFSCHVPLASINLELFLSLCFSYFWHFLILQASVYFTVYYPSVSVWGFLTATFMSCLFGVSGGVTSGSHTWRHMISAWCTYVICIWSIG